MRKIQYNKLVRDNIPDILEQEGVRYKCRYLTEEREIVKYLAKKLVEESKEFIDAFYGEGDMIEELNDVTLVLEELQNVCFKYIDVDTAMEKAADKDYIKGRFDKRILLESVEYKD